MVLDPMRGLYQKVAGGTWYVHRKVPKDLIGLLRSGPWLKESTGERDLKRAQLQRDYIWRKWDREISEGRGRRSRAGEVTLEAAAEALDGWRSQLCAAAASQTVETVESNPLDDALSWFQPFARQKAAQLADASGSAEPLDLDDPDVTEAARRNLRRFSGDDVSIALRFGRLQHAMRDPEGWRQIDGLDAELDAALLSAGVTGRLGPEVRAALRPRYISAALEVAQHQEWACQRARAVLSFVELRPEAIRLPDRRDTYQPVASDRTVGELVKAFRIARLSEYGDESTDRKYAHIFTALEQVLGAEKPVRAVTRKDCYRVRDLFRQLPSNATKKFKGLSLEEAIEAADTLDLEADCPEEMVARMKPKTVGTYMSFLSRVFNWGLKEEDGWCDTNPAKGLAGEEIEQVQRRGFTADEAAQIVQALMDERERTPWKFWLVLLGNYTGARLTELAQLHRGDIKSINGVDVINITRFDATGRLASDKRLKNKSSERLVPIHEDLIEAGFLSFVESVPSGRLFANIPERRGGIGHEPSKWFATLLDRLELTNPCLVYHSWRHGFRNACDAAGIDSDKRRALGGWASKDVADKYGDRHAVKMLSDEVAKLTFLSVRAALGL